MGQSKFDRTQTLYEIPKLNSLQDSAYKFLRADVAPASENSGLNRSSAKLFPLNHMMGKLPLRLRQLSGLTHR